MTPEAFSQVDKVAIVAGAGGGINKHPRRFVEAGARMACADLAVREYARHPALR
jgi:NADP-dependent 3-hydroxy acid dehydrogenase YdfG